MHKVVLDTNVIISGIIQKSGFPYKAVKLWEEGTIVLITSLSMVKEAEKVLNYPKIKKKYSLDEVKIKQTVLNLLRYSVLIDNPPLLDVIKDDPDDNKVLSTALKGKADYIVSGDSHLLGLKIYKGIEIVTPKGFCEIMGF
ncbi:MAG: putative toxin-antitoxin system toxin component, PIN family [Candidatus Roizmanbacteria bacterium]|nr:putative toxin-antitoxin system toxin component, PIN family [Candidatus Roizmanbacteria bacterium]